MKKSITLRSFPPNMPTKEKILIAKKYGYQGIEINLEQDQEFNLESNHSEFKKLLKNVKSNELQVTQEINGSIQFQVIICRPENMVKILSESYYMLQKFLKAKLF
jgi:hypothetical protein